MTSKAAVPAQRDPSSSLDSGKLPEPSLSTSASAPTASIHLSPMPPPSSLSAVHAAKGILRKQMRQTLASLDDATLAAQSSAVTQKILAHPAYVKATRLSVYISMPTGELRTDEIVRHALAHKKQVFIPYTPPIPKGAAQPPMQMLSLNSISDFESLVPNKWKIREMPVESLSSRTHALSEELSQGLDLILLPGLAFDRQRRRLGHGRGYYDAYLNACEAFSIQHKLQPTRTIALALNEQILPEGEDVPAVSEQEEMDFIAQGGHRDVNPEAIIFSNGVI